MAAALAAAVLHTGIWCQVQSSLMQGTSCSLQYRWILWGWLQVSAGRCSVYVLFGQAKQAGPGRY